MKTLAARSAAPPSAAPHSQARTVAVEVRPDQLAALARACNSLWLATLSLMTAFMHQPAPAHRLLLARRIANNLAMLREQECFDTDTRARFGTLSLRWQRKADLLAPYGTHRSPGMLARIQRLIAR